MKYTAGLAFVVVALAAGEVRGQGDSRTAESDPLALCIGMIERGTSTLRKDFGGLRERLSRCAPVVETPPAPVTNTNDQVLLNLLQNVIRTRLSSGVTKSSCGSLDVAFEGTTVIVKGQLSNRSDLEKAAADIKAFLPDLRVDIRGVDSLGCRKSVPRTNLTIMLDDTGNIRRLTLDQARSLGNVFPNAHECSVVGPSIASLLPPGSSNRRFWVWSEERSDPIYCVESAGSWDRRDYQLNDGRGAAVLRAQ